MLEPRHEEPLESAATNPPNPAAGTLAANPASDPPVIIGDEPLEVLATKANHCHMKYNRGCRSYLPYARIAGQALIAAKAQVGHGNWMSWVKHHFDASLDTAEGYLFIATHWEQIDAWLTKDPTLSIREAMRRVKRAARPLIVADPAIALEGSPTSTSNLNADTEAPTRTIITLTPAEEARAELKRWFVKFQDRLSDNDVEYLGRHGRYLWGGYLERLRREIGFMAYLVIPAEQRRDAARAVLWHEPEESRLTEEWKARSRALDLAFKVELLEELAVRFRSVKDLDLEKRLTVHEKEVLFWCLGINLNSDVTDDFCLADEHVLEEIGDGIEPAKLRERLLLCLAGMVGVQPYLMPWDEERQERDWQREHAYP